MKIVNVYNGDFIHSSQGGGMRYLRDLMQAQHRKGYAVELLAVGTGGPRQIDIEGVPVTYVPISRTLRWPVFLLNLFLYLLKNGKRYRSQVIHLHRVYFAPAFRFLVRNAHIVVTIHTKTFSVLTERFPIAEKLLPLILMLESLLIRTCVNRLSAAGEYAINLYSERHGIAHGDMVPLCGPSLMQPCNAPDPSLLDDTRKNILCVGRIASVKRPLSVLILFHATLLRAPSLTGTHRLVFIGDGEDRPKLESEIKRLGLTAHVKVLGSVNASRMGSIYAGGCCLVLLSTSETGPFTVKEALACGLPVFATRVGNVADYVPESCGTVIDVDKPEKSVNEFIDFLQHKFDDKECRRRAASIYLREQNQFDIGLIKLYQATRNPCAA